MYYVPSIQFNLFSIKKQLSAQGKDKVRVHFNEPNHADVYVGPHQRVHATAKIDEMLRLYMLILNKVKSD